MPSSISANFAFSIESFLSSLRFSALASAFDFPISSWGIPSFGIDMLYPTPVRIVQSPEYFELTTPSIGSAMKNCWNEMFADRPLLKFACKPEKTGIDNAPQEAEPL